MCTHFPLSRLYLLVPQLKAFNVITLPNGQFKTAVVEYVDHEAAQVALIGIAKVEALGKLTVQILQPHTAALLLRPAKVAPPDADPLRDLQPTTVLRLSNMTTEEDLADDELYDELLEDVADECNKHGTVRSVFVPRGKGDGTEAAVGEIFVHFTSSEGSSRALQSIAGRVFNGKTVKAVYYPESLFLSGTYVVPPGYNPLSTPADETSI